MRAKNILLIGAAFAVGFLLTKITTRKNQKITQLIEEAIYKGFAEIQNSKIALEKSNSTNIKIFAQRMIEDHIALNQKLTNIAHTKGIPTPDIEQHLDQVEPYLASYSGDDSFDERYVDNQLHAHYEIVSLFKKIGTVDDAELSQFAAHAVEHLGHHLRMAQDLADTFHTNNIPTSSSYEGDFVEEPNYKT